MSDELKSIGSQWIWKPVFAGYNKDFPEQVVEIVDHLPPPSGDGSQVFGHGDNGVKYIIAHHQSPTKRYEYRVRGLDGLRYYANDPSLWLPSLPEQHDA